MSKYYSEDMEDDDQELSSFRNSTNTEPNLKKYSGYSQSSRSSSVATTPRVPTKSLPPTQNFVEVDNDQKNQTQPTAASYGSFVGDPFPFEDPEEEWAPFMQSLRWGALVLGGLTFLVLFCMCLNINWWRDWGITAIHIMQHDMSDFMASTWEFLTYFGEDVPEFVAVVVYMSIDYGVGMRVCVLLSLVIYCNAVLKTGFHDCRPYWYTTDVTILAVCTRTWGFPATHASITASFYPFLVWEAYHFRKYWLSADFRAAKQSGVKIPTIRSWVGIMVVGGILFAVILPVGISRSVLGTHFPYQVIVGWMMGGTILQIYLLYSPHMKKKSNLELKPTFSSQMTNIIFLPILLAIIPIVIYHFVASTWQPPAIWNTNAHITCTQEDFGMDRSSAFIEAICGAAMYSMLCLISYWHDVRWPFETNQGSFGARFGRGVVGVFMVCVRAVFVTSAKSIHGIPLKALGMCIAIVCGNLCMFMLGPILCNKCCMMDPPRTQTPDEESTLLKRSVVSSPKV